MGRVVTRSYICTHYTFTGVDFKLNLGYSMLRRLFFEVISLDGFRERILLVNIYY